MSAPAHEHSHAVAPRGVPAPGPQARSADVLHRPAPSTAPRAHPGRGPATHTPRRRRRGPSEMDPRPGHISGLDGIRAIAIIGVLIFHYTPTVLPAGFLGVDVFFVLSGFLITTLLLRELAGPGRIDLLGFWKRRARRLLPALVTVVVVSIAAARVVSGDLLVNIGRQALGAMTFSTNWVEVAAGASYFHSTSPLLFINFWSLAVEEQFYLLWPLGLVVTVALTRTARQRMAVVLTLAVASAIAMAVLFQPGQDATRVYYGTDTHLFGLMLGVALAFGWAGPDRLGLQSAAWRRWRLPAVLGALVVLTALMALLSDDNPFTYRGGILLACLATTVLIAGLLESPSPWRTVMGLAPLRWLGVRSYGIYLWHWPVLMIVATLFPYAEGTTRGYVTLAGALALTLVLSELSLRFIEVPVRRHGFRATAGAVRDRVLAPARGPATKIAAGSVAILVLLAGVAVATAPDKSETQRAIEQAEAQLNAPPPAWAGEGGGDPTILLETVAGLLTGRGADGAAQAGADAPAEADSPAAGSEGATGTGADDGTATDGAPDSDTPPATDEGEEGDGSSTAGDGDPDGEETSAQEGDQATEQEGDEAAASDAAPPQGWSVDDDGLMVPDSDTLTAIGDSLVVTSADGLKWRFPEMNFVAKSNRQWGDANPVLEAALAEDSVRENVIVHFGTNAGVNADLLRQFLETLGPDRRVVVMNLYGSSTFVPDSNEAIEEVVADFPHAVVGDWKGTIEEQPEVLQSDRIHPDIEGMHVYAEVVARSFDELARNDG